MPTDPTLDPNTERVVDEMEETRRTLVSESYGEAAPILDRPVSARVFRVTTRMLSRVIADLSGGQVEPEFTAPQGDVDRIPGDVVAALAALDEFADGPQLDLETVVGTAEGFEELSQIFAEWRKTNGSGGSGGKRDTSRSATVAEQRAVGDRISAEQLATDYD